MPTITDAEFGEITVRRSHLARQVSLKVAPNGQLRISLPAYTPLLAAKMLIKSSRPRIRELLAEHAPTLRLDFVLADVGFVGSDRHLTQFAASLGAELAVADIRCHDGSLRHDPKRLADAYQELLVS